MCSRVKLIFKATFVGTCVNIEDGCGRINSVIGRVLSPVFFSLLDQQVRSCCSCCKFILPNIN